MNKKKQYSFEHAKLAIIGLGYVGLPLAIEFGKKFKTTGYDIKRKRIKDLNNSYDETLEVEKENVLHKNLTYSSNPDDLAESNIYIITVPTPVDSNNNPDLNHLVNSSQMVGKYLKEGDIVIYESTVYPGATEEVCVPILEKFSELRFNKDFFCGYSPERVNPGDKKHKLVDIKKVTSGSTPETANLIDALYSEIILAGTFKAKNIKTAEAAKVIENTQRDVNIALINELAIIFNNLNLDTKDVLEAANTKWNFLPFEPGLVGGHCIGVDPYYLTHKSIEAGYHPEMILSGRKINNHMPEYISKRVVSLLRKKNIKIRGSKILIMGFSFKENCPDFRNTKIIDLYNNLKKSKAEVDIYDPWVDSNEVKKFYSLDLLKQIPRDYYDAIIFAVKHDVFSEFIKNSFQGITKKNAVIFDVKNSLSEKIIDGRL